MNWNDLAEFIAYLLVALGLFSLSLVCLDSFLMHRTEGKR